MVFLTHPIMGRFQIYRYLRESGYAIAGRTFDMGERQEPSWMCDRLLTWLLAVLAAVCIAGVVPSAAQMSGGSNSSGADFNGTVYLLGEKEVQVTVPVNDSHLNFSLSGRALNMTLFDEGGRAIEYNSSYRYWRGDHIYSLVFSGRVRGRLVYTTAAAGQQFILPIREPVPVRIILPEGYTTGERALGIARPEPDELVQGINTTALTWYNTTSIPYIEVNYYRRSAPRALSIILSILGLAGAVLLVQYYLSMRRLKRSAGDLDGETQRGLGKR